MPTFLRKISADLKKYVEFSTEDLITNTLYAMKTIKTKLRVAFGIRLLTG